MGGDQPVVATYDTGLTCGKIPVRRGRLEIHPEDHPAVSSPRDGRIRSGCDARGGSQTFETIGELECVIDAGGRPARISSLARCPAVHRIRLCRAAGQNLGALPVQRLGKPLTRVAGDTAASVRECGTLTGDVANAGIDGFAVCGDDPPGITNQYFRAGQLRPVERKRRYRCRIQRYDRERNCNDVGQQAAKIIQDSALDVSEASEQPRRFYVHGPLPDVALKVFLDSVEKTVCQH